MHEIFFIIVIILIVVLLMKFQKNELKKTKNGFFGTKHISELDIDKRILVMLIFALEEISDEVKEVLPGDIRGPIPLSFDWRKEINLSKVLNQKDIGTCYAFSSASVMTDRMRILFKHDKEHPIHNNMISPYDIASCLTCGVIQTENNDNMEFNSCMKNNYQTPLNENCLSQSVICASCKDVDGSFMQCGLIYLEQKGGILLRDDKNQERYFCDEKSDFNRYKTLTHYHIGSYNIDNSINDHKINKIKMDIMKNGPVSAGFLITDLWDNFYNNLFNPTDIFTTDYVRKNRNNQYVNILGGHAISIVGWGKKDNVEYWIVRNSWGEEWGDKGYFYMEINCPEIRMEEDVWGIVLIKDEKQRSEIHNKIKEKRRESFNIMKKRGYKLKI